MNSIFSDVDRNRAAKILLVIGVLVALFLVGKAWNEFRVAGFIGRDGVVQSTITVEGRGEVVTKPDIANFSFTVIEEGKTVAEAQKKNTEKMNQALALIKDGGVDEKDVKTTGYNINPKYEYQNCPPFSACPVRDPQIIGYQVSQNVEVKVRDIEKSGALLSGVGSAGVQNISGLFFSVDDEEGYREQARAEAIEKAEEKAKQLARDLDVRLVRVISFSEYPGAYPVSYYGYGKGGVGMDAAVPQAANVSVPTGENEIVSQVNITYEIR